MLIEKNAQYNFYKKVKNEMGKSLTGTLLTL